MLVFHKIRWKNLLSYGNEFTAVDLASNRTTLIVGENGSGKSTLLDALVFALYGKPFRSVNKPQLINSITQKGALVEVAFTAGTNKYVVRRGIKPNLFEIIKNGVLLEQQACRDQQEVLESILKMNQKSFCQIVVLGLANFTPFMRLTAAQRRDVIEDLLDIQVFSAMNSLLKDRITQNKSDLQQNDGEIRLVESKIEMHAKYLEELRQNQQDAIDRVEAQIAEKGKHAEDGRAMLLPYREKLALLKRKLDGREQAIARLNKVLALKPQLMMQAARLQEQIEFYRTSETCPTCEQQISAESRAARIEERQIKIAAIETTFPKIADMKGEAENEVLKYNDIERACQVLEMKINEEHIGITSLEMLVDKLRAEAEQMRRKQQRAAEDDGTKTVLDKTLRQLQQQRDELVRAREVLAIAGKLLKDGGIKGRIIRQYIPILNKLVNSYLQALDFFVEFYINEEFQETIKSRHRDEFSYESFSQGERLRIDLSLMFTWRAIARLRNSTTTNLLILDEVLDSSLDTNGVTDFMEIVKTLTKGTNTIIISHKMNELDDFEHVIQIEKRDNFSRIAA